MRTTDGETDGAIDQREQRMVATHADVVAGVNACAALTQDDAACAHRLAPISLDAEHFRLGIAAISR